MASEDVLRMIVKHRAKGQCECEGTMMSCTHHMHTSRCANPIASDKFKLHKHGPSRLLSRMGEGSAYALCDTCFENWIKMGLQP